MRNPHTSPMSQDTEASSAFCDSTLRKTARHDWPTSQPRPQQAQWTAFVIAFQYVNTPSVPHMAGAPNRLDQINNAHLGSHTPARMPPLPAWRFTPAEIAGEEGDTVRCCAEGEVSIRAPKSKQTSVQNRKESAARLKSVDGTKTDNRGRCMCP